MPIYLVWNPEPYYELDYWTNDMETYDVESRGKARSCFVSDFGLEWCTPLRIRKVDLNCPHCKGSGFVQEENDGSWSDEEFQERLELGWRVTCECVQKYDWKVKNKD